MQTSSSLVAERHAHAASVLWLRRDMAVVSPHYSLADLEGLDGQLEANLDGLRIAGDSGWQICLDELRWREPGEVFVAALLALEMNDAPRVDAVLQVVDRAPELQRAFVSACGWLPPEQFLPWADPLWNRGSPDQQSIALGGYTVHRVDAGSKLDQALESDYLPLRARALRAVGDLARLDLLPRAVAAMRDSDPRCRLVAACTVARLTDDADALRLLEATLDRPEATGIPRHDALQVLTRRLTADHATAWIQRLAADPQTRRDAIIAAGCAGLSELVPWLLQAMAIESHARVAGEALAMITGADLSDQQLQCDPPAGFRGGPTDDPDDDQVELDQDENLPWPDRAAVDAWWSRSGQQFSPGVRYMLGRPIERQWLVEVLRSGLQRQRANAAWELAIRDPATPRFNVEAPAKRQRLRLDSTTPRAPLMMR